MWNQFIWKKKKLILSANRSGLGSSTVVLHTNCQTLTVHHSTQPIRCQSTKVYSNLRQTNKQTNQNVMRFFFCCQTILFDLNVCPPHQCVTSNLILWKYVHFRFGKYLNNLLWIITRAKTRTVFPLTFVEAHTHTHTKLRAMFFPWFYIFAFLFNVFLSSNWIRLIALDLIFFSGFILCAKQNEKLIIECPICSTLLIELYETKIIYLHIYCEWTIGKYLIILNKTEF